MFSTNRCLFLLLDLVVQVALKFVEGTEMGSWPCKLVSLSEVERQEIITSQHRFPYFTETGLCCCCCCCCFCCCFCCRFVVVVVVEFIYKLAG